MYVVWKKPDNEIYYKFVKGTCKNYYIGYKNQYCHEVICIIKENYNYKKYYSFPLKRALRRFLRWLYYKI